ncbi:MAG: pyrroline-5-carboxylate reductase [Candidatus Omnitrophica bacterium]|nr:pyrroline-5-carboxylate reductase [Candidatus Omnitrophota bacterium]
MSKIGIIGGGNMGSAILAGIGRKFTVRVCEQDARRAGLLKRRFGVKAADLATVAAGSRIIILAVKPQNFDEVLGRLRGRVRQDQLIISIAAGITCRYIEQRSGQRIRVVRAMPNLPAQVGEAVTGICPGKFATSADVKTARQIFNCIGKTVIVDERLMDAITAVSGSGPGYIFYFAECLEKAARSMGLSPTMARELVTQTLKGSARLLERSGEGADVLRGRVTSKGGTTQAALAVLQKHKMGKILQQALAAAKKRAKELSK